jgi:hypothetical protein
MRGSDQREPPGGPPLLADDATASHEVRGGSGGAITLTSVPPSSALAFRLRRLGCQRRRAEHGLRREAEGKLTGKATRAPARACLIFSRAAAPTASPVIGGARGPLKDGVFFGWPLWRPVRPSTHNVVGAETRQGTWEGLCAASLQREMRRIWHACMD